MLWKPSHWFRGVLNLTKCLRRVRIRISPLGSKQVWVLTLTTCWRLARLSPSNNISVWYFQTPYVTRQPDICCSKFKQIIMRPESISDMPSLFAWRCCDENYSGMRLWHCYANGFAQDAVNEVWVKANNARFTVMTLRMTLVEHHVRICRRLQYQRWGVAKDAARGIIPRLTKCLQLLAQSFAC